MREHDLDLMTLYGYADSSHAAEREVWRDFLSYLLPVLFQMDGQEIAALLEESITDDVESVLEADSKTIGNILREVSGELAHALQLDREFGFAAFLDGEFPTKVYPLRRKKAKVDETETSKWIMQFSRIQKDPELEQILADLKNKLDGALETEDEFQESA